MKKYKNFIKTSLVFIILLSIFIMGATLEYQKVVANKQVKLEDELIVVKTNIEQMILSRIINAKGISGFLEISEDFTDATFSVFAETMYDSVNHVVKDIVLITDTTISHVYPSHMAVEAVGVDLAEVALQSEILLYTKNTGHSVFFGPVDLIEGGKGIIIRVPIFLEEAYYGQLAIVFDYYNFIEVSGIKQLADDNFVSLSGSDPTSGDEAAIWYNTQEISNDCLATTIKLNDMEWVLKACPAKGWSGTSQIFKGILMVGLIFSGATAMVYYRQLYLKDQLLSANGELLESFEKLTESKSQLTCHYNEIKEKEAYIRYLADHDSLTKLYNRRKFNEQLEMLLTEGFKGSIVLLDLDNFKNVNDIHGHIHGDKLLSHIAEIIKKVIDGKGNAYRFGGDEFLILFDRRYTFQQIDETIKKISRDIVRLNIADVTNHVTISSGIVTFPEDGHTVETLLIKADVAMYSAKYSGKNQSKMFNEGLLKDFDSRIEIENTLRESLAHDGFMIYYQPIIDIKTGEIVNFEALLRLKDFRYSPMEFIPVAEETGIIMPLGQWIIEEVVGQLRNWMDEGLDPKPVAINLSPKQLVDADFLTIFLGILKSHDIPCSLVEVEITESILLENESENLVVLNGLRDAGIRISMDDFGTGYSSLNYLTYLPVDKVKLDKSLKDKFLKMDNPQVLAGIIAMSHGLELKVVAEGVETEGEWTELQGAGCDYLQGYLFSRPVPSEEVKGLMNRKY